MRKANRANPCSALAVVSGNVFASQSLWSRLTCHLSVWENNFLQWNRTVKSSRTREPWRRKPQQRIQQGICRIRPCIVVTFLIYDSERVYADLSQQTLYHDNVWTIGRRFSRSAQVLLIKLPHATCQCWRTSIFMRFEGVIKEPFFIYP